MKRFVSIDELFSVRSGDFHATDKELSPGNVPLVSCGDVNHGLVGLFDIPKANRYRDAVTVAYNGQPLAAKYRPYAFGAKDDIGILKPRGPISPRALVYIAAMLNARRWRYSYGRKCFKNKLQAVDVEVPVRKSKRGGWRLDAEQIDRLLGHLPLDMRPATAMRAASICLADMKLKEKRLDEIFDLKRGDFHSLKELASGEYATVSRTEADNGVVGYFERPSGSVVYDPGIITVSTVSGDAFVQAERFIATDNVVMCIPREPMRPSSAYFIAAMINGQKWRYGYGRQPYIGKLSGLTINVPSRKGRLDEAMIEAIVRRQPYWSYVGKQDGVKQ